MTPRLSHGDFFGVRESACDAAGFAISVKSAHPTVQVERHTHDDAHFILLLDGHYLSTARGAGHLHAEPALIFNPPGTTHRDTFPDRTGRFVGISLSAACFEATREIGAVIEHAERIWDPAALGIAHAVAQLAIADRELLAIENACVELVASFVRMLRHDEGVRPPRWLRLAREAFHDRAHAGDEDLSVAAVAREVGVHPVHLARAFRRYFGCTPAAYVRRVRTERAARMVRSTSAGLADIAASCGFVDQSHMSRAFARDLGATPAAYRRRHRG